MAISSSQDAPAGGVKRFIKSAATVEPTSDSIVVLGLYRQGEPAPVQAIDLRSLVGELEANPSLIGWIAFDRPHLSEIQDLAKTLDLHPLLVEDIIVSHQRPKIERYGKTLFCVVKPAVYDEKQEDILLGETHLIMSGRLVVCINQRGDNMTKDGWWATEITRRFASHPGLLSSGPEAILYAAIDSAADDYAPALQGIMDDVDEIERQVFSGDAAAPERIYRLSRELVDLQHAIVPLQAVVRGLQRGFEKYDVAQGLRAYLADVADHLTRDAETTAELRELLTSILDVNSTLVAQRQNEDMKRISSWAAIIFTPSVIGSIYGMNFANMPELDWVWGYPVALGLMLGSAVLLWAIFKQKGWL